MKTLGLGNHHGFYYVRNRGNFMILTTGKKGKKKHKKEFKKKIEKHARVF